MERGYVRLWRRILDAGMLQRPEIFAFFGYCLLKATHRKRSQIVGNTIVELEPGQFVFGRKRAAQELKTTERKIRTALVTLEKLQIVTIKPTNKFSIVSLINWGTYQNVDPLGDQQSDQEATSKRPASDQQVTTDKNVKKGNNEKKKSKPFVPPSVEEVTAYCHERGNGIDPQEFIDHYEANGWMRGKNKIQNWKACIGTWEAKRKKESKPKAQRGQEHVKKGRYGI